MTVHTPERAREWPQIAGPAVLVAPLAQDIPVASTPAIENIARLTERDWGAACRGPGGTHCRGGAHPDQAPALGMQ